MDETHLAPALRYGGALLVERARDWRWSSTRAHFIGKDDSIMVRIPSNVLPGFADLLDDGVDTDTFARLRVAEDVGRGGTLRGSRPFMG
jgi:putative transposase